MSFISVILLIALIPIPSLAAEPNPKCFKADTVKVWEEKYCLSKSGAADSESEAYLECAKGLKKAETVPKKKCARVKWLKDKACSDDPGTGRKRKECLTDRNYLKNIDDEPYTGP